MKINWNEVFDFVLVGLAMLWLFGVIAYGVVVIAMMLGALLS